jgi:hypothetical protein
MNTPSIDLPQPEITKPLSFRPVKRPEKEQRKQYLDNIISSSFLKSYFKKKIKN